MDICTGCWKEINPQCSCGVKILFDFPKEALKSIRILVSKGWAILGCKIEGKNGEVIRVEFGWLAPPVVSKDINNIGSKDWRSRFNSVVEIKGTTRPDVLFRGDDINHSLNLLFNWAKESPNLILPFSQKLCDLCKSQGGDWLFCRCKCPVVGGFVCFHDGLPDKCVYAAEQVVTTSDRLKVALMVYNDYPVAKKRLCQSVQYQTV